MALLPGPPAFAKLPVMTLVAAFFETLLPLINAGVAPAVLLCTPQLPLVSMTAFTNVSVWADASKL
jgi:hypothetical protein